MDITQRIRVAFEEVNAPNFQAALGGMSSILGRVTSMINPLNVAIASIAGGGALAGVASVGSQYEDLRIQMAQTMRFMGRGGDTFAGAMAAADVTMQQINVAAAALPGSAEDYQRAMQMAGADVRRATGDYQSSFNLIRDMTAIGIGLGHSSEESAMVLTRALNTQHGMLDAGSGYAVELVNSMRQLPGLANVTTGAFNAMALPQRVEVMQQLVGQYGDMLEASSHTWTAVTGSAETLRDTLFRLASAPLFAVMVAQLERVNALFMDSQGGLTNMGRLVTGIGHVLGDTVGSALVKIVDVLSEMSAGAEGFIRRFMNSPIVKLIDSMLNGLTRIGGALSGGVGGIAEERGGESGAATGMIAGGAVLAGLAEAGVAVFGPLGIVVLAVAAGFGSFLTHTQEVAASLAALTSIFGMLSSIIQPVMHLFAAVGDVVGGLLAGILPGLLEGIQMLVAPLVEFTNAFLAVTSLLFEHIRPTLQQFGVALGAVLHGVGAVLAPIIRLVGGILIALYSALESYLMPVVNTLIEAFGFLIGGIGHFLSWLGSVINDGVTALLPATVGGHEAPEAAHFRAMLNGLADGMAGTTAAVAAVEERATQQTRRNTPAGRGGGNTVQDFRGSRFNIQQKFEEGFDPDRIATAFAADLQRVGRRALQSGFEPAFGVR